jgi:hypothetical protein
MSYREQGMGVSATFLIPSAKLQSCSPKGVTLEKRLHEFLMTRFGGYTTSSADLHGYWVSPGGESCYGEHREYRVFLNGGEGALGLKRFLAKIAAEIDEQCICYSSGDRSCFVFPPEPPEATRNSRVLFVTPSEVSSGEAVTALHMGEDLAAKGWSVRFLSSRFTGDFLAPRLGDRVTVLGRDLAENRRCWEGVLDDFQPGNVVFADYPLLSFAGAAAPLWDSDWEEALPGAETALFTLDHLGYAQRPGLVFFGPPHETIGVQRIQPLPPGIRILLPCPLHDPEHSPLRGHPFRLPGLNGAANPNGADARERRLRSGDELLVLHFVSHWACDAARLIESPYYSLFPEWLVRHLSGAGRPVTVISVNNGALLPELESDGVRIVNARPMPPTDFEALLAAADLVLTENRISVSLARAISMLRPAAVLRNTRSVLDISRQGPAEAAVFAEHMERARIGSVFPFEVFPIWSRADLELLGIFNETRLGGAFDEIEFFGGEASARQLHQLLTDPSARARMREAQLSYLRRLESLPSCSQVFSPAAADRTALATSAM